MRLGFSKGLRYRRLRRGRGDRRLDRGGSRCLRRLVDVVDTQRTRHILLQRTHQTAAGEAGSRLLHFVETLLQVGHFSFAHRFLELALEFGGHLPRLADPLPDHAKHARQLFRADGNQRDNRDEEKFTPADVEHEKFRSRVAALPVPSI
jgi:hypothetical protein